MPLSSRMWSRVWFGFPLVILLAVALWLRLMTVDRFLPALDYGDESNMFTRKTPRLGNRSPL